MKRFVGIFLTIPLLVFASPKIVIENPWVKEPPPGPKTTMAGMVIKNEGDEEDALIEARSDVAKRVELHKTVFENGVAKMVPQKEIVIPPKGEVELKHHDYHIMLIDLKRKLRPGQKVKLTLVFKKSGEITVEAPVVKKPKAMQYDHHHQHHH